MPPVRIFWKQKRKGFIMNEKEIADKLSSLVQLDIDAIHAYDQAIDKIDVPSIHEQLRQFRDDHHRHVTDLSAAIRQLGGTPPDFSPDFKGYFIQGFTSLRSMTGTEGALKAMRTNEQLTNRTYEEASSWSLSPSIHALIEQNYADEKRHIMYIDQAIESRIWEQETVTS